MGALAFGASQVLGATNARLGAARKTRAIARLARRSLVEMANGCQGRTMASWIEDIGSSRALEPTLQLLRELLDVAAPLGGVEAKQAERALHSFLRAADQINPLWLQRPQSGEFDKKNLARKGRILGALIDSIEALALIEPPRPGEPKVSDKVTVLAVKLDEWYGWVPA